MDRAVTFGPGGRLMGVLSEPSPAIAVPHAPAVLMWNVGLNHHVGPYRFNVDLARSLAARGFASLRFDVSGLGDSDVRKDGLGEMDRTLDDLQEAMALVRDRVQTTRFVPVGFCSSVDAAHQLALRGPALVCAGACFIEGYNYRTAGFYRRFPLRLLDARRWARWAMHRVPRSLRRITGVDVLLDNPVVRAEQGAVYVREYPSREALAADYEKLARNGLRMLFVYVGGASSYSHEGQFFEMLRSTALRDRVDVAYYESADHTFFRVAHRERVVGRIAAWMDHEFGAAKVSPHQA